jgi:predicted neutral ceramidase superfamily lipid hydrolase
MKQSGPLCFLAFLFGAGAGNHLTIGQLLPMTLILLFSFVVSTIIVFAWVDRSILPKVLRAGWVSATCLFFSIAWIVEIPIVKASLNSWSEWLWR